MTEEAKEIAREIGYFYLEKNNGNNDATEKEINDLDITNIEISGPHVFITTRKPGRLIGPRGKNIESLVTYLERPIKIFEDVS